MTITLGDVEVVAAPAILPTVTLPPKLVTVTTPVPAPTVAARPPALPTVTGTAPSTSGATVVALAGPRGPQGMAGGEVFEYLMPIAQTTVLVDHPLGYDPVAVQVLVDGELCAEYSVVYTIPMQQVRVAFDISVQALIRLM